MTAQPDFARDYDFGYQGESYCKDLIDVLRVGSFECEVKRKRIPDLRIYVETHHDPGRTGSYIPSGVTKTRASVYAVVVSGDCVIFLPTDRLRRAIALGLGREIAGGQDGDCPTLGRLIPLEAIISTRCEPC